MLRRSLLKMLSTVPIFGMVGLLKETLPSHNVIDLYLYSKHKSKKQCPITIIYKDNLYQYIWFVPLANYTDEEYREMRNDCIESYYKQNKIKNLLAINIYRDNFRTFRNGFFIDADVVDINETVSANQLRFARDRIF